MVTNLPKEARAQWRRVSEAKDPRTKLEELKKFYSMIPKHKGTKNLLRHVRRQMARLREEIEERKRKGGATQVTSWTMYKQGVARIALLYDDYRIGVEVFKRLSNKEIDDSSIWRFEPIYGILQLRNIQYQLTLLPPMNISESIDYRILNYVKSTADYVMVVGPDTESVNEILDRLASEGLYIGSSIGRIEITKTPIGGIRIIGGIDLNHNEIEKLLHAYKIYNAIVKIEGSVTLEDIEDHILGIRVVKPGSAAILREDIELYPIERNKIEYNKHMKIEDMSRHVLSSMGLIRIYTKPYKEEVSEKPIIVRKGTTVIELAEEIHSTLARNFKYAVIIRGGKRIKASKDTVLEDGDIITIYI